MADFISGILTEIRVGAMYEGQVYDYWLKLRHSSGQLLEIFDMSAVAGGLVVGETYEVVLVTSIMHSIKVCSAPQKASKPEHWQGTVLTMNWNSSEDLDKSYQCYDPYLHDNRRSSYMMVQTPIGCLLMITQEIEQEIGRSVQEGLCLTWSRPRLDLYAVL